MSEREEEFSPDGYYRIFKRQTKAHAYSVAFAKFVLLLVGLATAWLGVMSGIVELDDGTQFDGVIPFFVSLSGIDVGLVSCGAFAFLLGSFLLVAEGGPLDAIDNARRAIEHSEKKYRLAKQTEELAGLFEDRMIRTGTLVNAIRGYQDIAGFVASTDILDDAESIKPAFYAITDDLEVALGFQHSFRWSISIYQAKKTAEGHSLVLIATHRSVACPDLSLARVWPLGVGIAGIVAAKNDEACVPDAMDPSAGSVFEAPLGDESLSRENDAEIHRSMFGVSIDTQNSDYVWGAVVVTCDQAHHFGGEERAGDPRNAARALSSLASISITNSERTRALQSAKTAAKGTASGEQNDQD